MGLEKIKPFWYTHAIIITRSGKGVRRREKKRAKGRRKGFAAMAALKRRK